MQKLLKYDYQLVISVSAGELKDAVQKEIRRLQALKLKEKIPRNLYMDNELAATVMYHQVRALAELLKTNEENLRKLASPAKKKQPGEAEDPHEGIIARSFFRRQARRLRRSSNENLILSRAHLLDALSYCLAQALRLLYPDSNSSDLDAEEEDPSSDSNDLQDCLLEFQNKLVFIQQIEQQSTTKTNEELEEEELLEKIEKMKNDNLRQTSKLNKQINDIPTNGFALARAKDRRGQQRQTHGSLISQRKTHFRLLQAGHHPLRGQDREPSKIERDHRVEAEVKMEEQARSLKSQLEEKVEVEIKLNLEIDRLSKEIDRMKQQLEKFLRELTEKELIIKMER
ncbi:uncharacterized protein LOC116244993 [Nymphaea colorata]|uniref:uncharacterized protein LOC116244993 n=1 Tax=Nymphaea colorata TaxID=210225 RepID=UPI00129DA04F|nr:uncharacterized protein LOC116244993 [Nymphaea colorata]